MCKRIFYNLLICFLFVFQTSVTLAQNVWNPSDGYLGMEALDVTFIDANKGFAVGDFGKMIRTLDGGMNWSYIESGTSQPIFCIQFTSATTGYAAGGNGVFLKTIDGGSTWSILNSGAVSQTNSIHFVSDSEGWIVGSAEILHTQDGGITWDNQFTNNNVELKSVNFVNSTSGWAVGFDHSTNQGFILSTVNGGATWTSQTSNTSQRLNSVFFTNVNDGFIVGWNGTLLSTNDGGLNWSTALSNPFFGMMNDIRFKSSTEGVIVGDFGRIVVTIDGGQTWTEQNFYYSQVDLLSVFFVDNSNGWIAGTGCMLGTTDGGANWEFQIAEAGYPLSGMDFFSSANGLMVGYEGKILRSIDEGATWDLEVSATNSWLLDVEMTTDSTAWAVGQNGAIINTTDGGNTWNSLLVGNGQELHSVNFPTENNGWIVGVNTILATNDGGLSWTDQNNGHIYLWDVEFVNADNGWIVGDNGLVLKTVDAGANWIVQNIGINSYFKSVHFVTEFEGWIIGHGGTVCHTTDGGLTWELQYAAVSNPNLTSIHFISPEQGWLTSYSEIFVTSNGGEDWVLQYEEPLQYHDLSKIYFTPDANKGFVFGGTFLQYDCTNVPISLTTFSQPSTDQSCDGKLFISASGSGGFSSSIDGNPSVNHSGNAIFTDLCPGVHSLSINDLCGHSNTIDFIIPVDSNYIENDPFGNSIGIDSIGAIVENCSINYYSIDSAYIENIWASGDTINVVWNVIDNNGAHYDTVEYLLVSGNGIYWLQYSFFCPQKEASDYFTVSEVVYYQNGNVSLAGIKEHKESLFQIFPNPTNKQIEIATSIPDEQALTVVNVYGEVLIDQEVTFIKGKTITVDLSEFSPGVYFVRVGNSVEKVVKE